MTTETMNLASELVKAVNSKKQEWIFENIGKINDSYENAVTYEDRKAAFIQSLPEFKELKRITNGAFQW